MGLNWAFFETNTVTSKSLEILKNFFRFSYIESFVILGNLFPFFYLSLNIFLEFFTFLTSARNFNLSAGNLGLFEKNGICFVRSIVN